MSQSNNADDRRGVRKGRPKVAARARRRVSAPSLEGLESRALLSTVPGQGALPAAAVEPQYVPGEVLVQYKPGVGEGDRAKVRGKSEAVLKERIHTKPMRDAMQGVVERVTVGAGRSVEATIQALESDPAVAFAEPNQVYTTQATSNDPVYNGGSLWGMYGDATAPANPYGSQAGEAWAAGHTGTATVYIGVIDEGIDFTHPDLASNIWVNPNEIPGNNYDDDNNGYDDDVHGYDFFHGDASIYDGAEDDHGTHVAGTIGAVGGNGAGVAGVAWDVQLISGKFLGPNGGDTVGAIEAIDYFIDLKRRGMNIVALNNSWGGGPSQLLHNAIIRAAQEGILFVAAAGNGGWDQRGDNNDAIPSYPSNYSTTAGAGYEAVIAVAAIDSGGNKGSFSNYGATTVDLGAPGVNIQSTLPGGRYGAYSGTSMATPHVTGAIALYAASNPTAGAKAIRDKVLGTVAPTASLSKKTATVTKGRLDVGKLMLGSPTPPPRPGAPVAPSGLTAATLRPHEITLSWTDESTNEAGFKVEQSTDNGVTFTVVALAGADAVEGDTEQFTVTGLNSSSTYYFRVLAYNAGGDSIASNIAYATTPAVVYTYEEVFADHFDVDGDTTDWSFVNGKWFVAGGVLQQTNSTTNADKELALVMNSTNATRITAKVRVDAWKEVVNNVAIDLVDGKPAEYPRAGVTLAGGYSLVFTQREGKRRIEFVNDGTAWSGWPTEAGAKGYTEFAWKVGTQYLFDMRMEEGKLIGEVKELAQGGTPTGVGASLTFDASKWSRTGLAGVNGGAFGTHTGQNRTYSTASFDDVTAYTSTTSTASGGLASAPATRAASVTGLSLADPTPSVDADVPGAEDVATSPLASLEENTAEPQFIESGLVADEAPDSWFDEALAKFRVRRPRRN